MIVNVNEYEKLFDEWIVSKDDLSSDILIELKEKAPDEIKELFSKLTAVIAREDKSSKSLFHSLVNSVFKIGGPGSGNFGHAGRPGLVGGSAPRKPNASVGACKEWREKVENRLAREYNRYFPDMSFDEYKQKVDEWLKDSLGNRNDPVKIRVDQYTLYQIVQDGGFKTQFETQTSGGVLNNGLRAHFEKNVFGIPEENIQSRPIYGYIFKGDDNIISHYGQAIVVLKDEVKNRTSFTFGDSLDNNAPWRNYEGSSAPAPLNSPDYLAVPARIFPKDPSHMADSSYYTEAQIFGGVNIRKDVKEVIFTGPNKPNLVILDALESVNVPSRYVEYYVEKSLQSKSIRRDGFAMKMKNYEVVAQRGENSYLLTADGGKMGRVLDLDVGEFFPEFNFQSILMRGYWEEYTGDKTAEELIKEIENK